MYVLKLNVGYAFLKTLVQRYLSGFETSGFAMFPCRRVHVMYTRGTQEISDVLPSNVKKNQIVSLALADGQVLYFAGGMKRSSGIPPGAG